MVSLASPTAVAVDLGSGTAGLWATHRGVISRPTGDAHTGRGLVHRGRITDVDGCATLLTRLLQHYPQPVADVDVVVACRPTLSTDTEQGLMRQVLHTAFAPRRVLLIDTVRAAAIGSGATAGDLLIVDVGAHLTETALLREGHTAAARRADIGTRDLRGTAAAERLADVVARHVDELRTVCSATSLHRATSRGVLLVGGGVSHSYLPPALSAALGSRVHRVATPRTAALNGAALAATAALRHPALS
ncbi:rod shape-determining protein [Actinoplanes campanulatus]|uniref:rod shape-determining protein n=1 Tax=Actinoplanes campanulatus TaxID=113559 RepID=UPI00195332F4|nr:rod shape-determining protein [Actinoplanes capillaceus]